MTQFFRNLSLRLKIVFLVSAVVAVLSAFLIMFFPQQMGAMAERSVQRRAETMAVLLSDALVPYLEFDDDEGIQALFEKVSSATDIDYAAIRLFDKSTGRTDAEILELEPYYAWNKKALPAVIKIPESRYMVVTVGDELRVTARIDAKDGGTAGLLILGISLVELREQQQKNLLLVVLVSAILFIVGVGSSIVIGTITVRPIQALTRIVADIVAKGDLTQKINIDSTDEVGQLALSFNAMVDKLQTLPRRLTEIVESVTSVTEKAAATMGMVSSGASAIHSRVAGAASALHQMNASLESIAESVDEVHKNAAESSTANQEMVTATQSINGRVATMASSVEGADAAVLKTTAAMKQIANRVAELDSVVETTASAMTEMNASIQNVEVSAIETNDLSKQVAQDAETGVVAIERTLDGIGKIAQSSEAASGVIESLGARIQNIGGILEVIVEVASRTKLLALNAAIIAAQAGEHGRGFGVLADQIKELAARTNASASEIGDLITNIQSESATALAAMREGTEHVHDGVRLGNEASEVLRKIRQSAILASDRVRMITNATVEQARATKRVLDSVDVIATTVQDVATAADAQARGSEEIVTATMQVKESTEAVRRSSAEQTSASEGIARSVARISEMIGRVSQAQREQAMAAGNTLETVEEIRAVADEQLLAIDELGTAITSLRKRSDALNWAVRQFRV